MREPSRPTLVLLAGALLGLLLGGCGGADGQGGATPAAGADAAPGSGILFVRAEMRTGIFPECPSCPGPVPGTEEIWVMNPDGSGQRRLTDDRRRDTEPRWSPDGTRILFVSQTVPGAGDAPGDDPDIWVMNADGSGKRNLTHHESADLQPRWSPDGRQIAFTSDRDGNRDLFLMNADGSNVRNLTQHAASDADPAFSPDGTRIAFRSGREPAGAEIFVMNLDGSGIRNVSRQCCEPPCCGAFGPLWSSDASKILFTSGRFGAADEEPVLLVVDADGSGLRLLDTEAEGPRFTRDGTEVLYTSTGGLVLANIDGSGRRFLVVDPPGTFSVAPSPVLGPDGRRFAVAGHSVDQQGAPVADGIFVIDLDSATPTNVPAEVRVDATPVTNHLGDLPADWR